MPLWKFYLCQDSQLRFQPLIIDLCFFKDHVLLLKICMHTLVQTYVHLHLPFHMEKKILCKPSNIIPLGKEMQETEFSKRNAVGKKKINAITEKRLPSSVLWLIMSPQVNILKNGWKPWLSVGSRNPRCPVSPTRFPDKLQKTSITFSFCLSLSLPSLGSCYEGTS